MKVFIVCVISLFLIISCSPNNQENGNGNSDDVCKYVIVGMWESDLPNMHFSHYMDTLIFYENYTALDLRRMGNYNMEFSWDWFYDGIFISYASGKGNSVSFRAVDSNKISFAGQYYHRIEY